MRKTKECAILDDFRLVAAFLVVAIHVGPFSAIQETLDFYLTYVIGRIGVPFYLMVTGYFVLPGFEKKTYFRKVWRFVGRQGILYLAVTVFYLPLSWYAGNLPKTPGEALRALALDGTFYHLWYLPAVMAGCLITAGLLSVLRPAGALVAAGVLYLIGVLGDSWYGLAVLSPPLRAFYSALSEMGSYTRNGLFFAPVFLWAGAMAANGFGRGIKKRGLCAGAGISLCAMLVEGGFTRAMGWQRHNSMYFCLFPAALSGFLLLLRLGAEGRDSLFFRRPFSPVFLRKTAMWIYLLHPFWIVVLRGLAGIVGWEKVMVEQSLILYLEVCVLSAAAGAVCALLGERIADWRQRGGREDVSERKSVD